MKIILLYVVSSPPQKRKLLQAILITNSKLNDEYLVSKRNPFEFVHKYVIDSWESRTTVLGHVKGLPGAMIKAVSRRITRG